MENAVQDMQEINQ